jgi:hypothetical protein
LRKVLQFHLHSYLPYDLRNAASAKQETIQAVTAAPWKTAIEKLKHDATVKLPSFTEIL